jgi:hypothetical protein
MKMPNLSLQSTAERRPLNLTLGFHRVMPIPDDPLNRWWVEASSANPTLVSDLRPTLIAFLAFDHGRTPRIAGSGFVIAGMPDLALVVTAKHVLSEGVVNIQRPVAAYSASALFVPNSAKIPSLSPEKLKGIWMGSEHADLLNAAHAYYNDTLDIACCVVSPQQLHSTRFSPISIPIHTTVPAIGDVIPSTPSLPTRTFYEMMRNGALDKAVGGIDHIEIVDLGNDDCRIGIRHA